MRLLQFGHWFQISSIKSLISHQTSIFMQLRPWSLSLTRSTWDPNPTIPFNKNKNIAFNLVNVKSQSWNIIPFLVLLWFAIKMEENEWYGGELDQSLPLARTSHRLLEINLQHLKTNHHIKTLKSSTTTPSSS
jgi:hypothetical protein